MSDFGLALLLCLVVACNSNRAETVQRSEEERAARTAFFTALRVFQETPESPEAYATFASRAAALRPELSSEFENRIELCLTFLAFPVLTRVHGTSPLRQMNILAATVWPTALKTPLHEGEMVEDYVERLCRGDEWLNCEELTLDGRSRVMGAKVVRSIHYRAEAAYSKCRECQDDPTYREALERFNPLVRQAEAEIQERPYGGEVTIEATLPNDTQNTKEQLDKNR